MDEKNINISKSEEELLEIMENRSHITADQLHNLKEDEECLQACSLIDRNCDRDAEKTKYAGN